MQNLGKKKVRFSYTRLNQYENCPYSYKLKYEQGLFIDPPGLAAAFGTALHKVNEIISNAIIAGKPIPYEDLKKDFYEWNIPKKSKYDREGDLFGMDVLAKKFPKEWNDFNTKSGKSYAVKAREFINDGIYAQERFLQEHPELELVGVEVAFEYEYRGYVFAGFIDRLLRYKDDPNHFVVHDIKTKDHPFDEKRDLTTPLQFVVYCNALRDKYGADITIDCFYDLPVIQLMQRGGTKGFETRGRKKIDKLLDGIEDKNFYPNPTPLCYWCSYSNTNPKQPVEGRNLCPYYSMWMPDNHTFDKKFEWQGADKHEFVMNKFLQRITEESSISVSKPRRFNFDF